MWTQLRPFRVKTLTIVHKLINVISFRLFSNCSVVPHIVMQENFFYVDKDILDARARGEADLLEVPHACLTIGREIGKGAFGRVYIARADNINGIQGSQVVAVKKLKSSYLNRMHVLLHERNNSWNLLCSSIVHRTAITRRTGRIPRWNCYHENGFEASECCFINRMLHNQATIAHDYGVHWLRWFGEFKPQSPVSNLHVKV